MTALRRAGRLEVEGDPAAWARSLHLLERLLERCGRLFDGLRDRVHRRSSKHAPPRIEPCDALGWSCVAQTGAPFLAKSRFQDRIVPTTMAAQPPTVLLIDDEPSLLVLLQAAMRRAGFADVKCAVSLGIFREYTGRKA